MPPRRRQRRSVRVPAAQIGLSTASVYPDTAAIAFEMAARLGYDGVEVMVWTDPLSQDVDALRALSDYHGVPVLAVHAPCLVITQRVWSTDPWVKLQKAQAAAARLGARTVVVHPPFRWQRDYARQFRAGIERMSHESDVRFAVENMFPLRVREREVSAYQPSWDVAADEPAPGPRDPGPGPAQAGYRDYTLDLSHASVSQSDALDMLERMGERLSHLHIADGTGLAKDEHLVPGRGDQPCAQILERLAQRSFTGSVIVEVNTRKAVSRDDREDDLAEALAFCRLNLAAPAE